MKKRLDLILVEREFFETREKAKREIMAGNVIVNEQVVTKAGTMFKDNDDLNIRIKGKLKYVSRGGLKLEKAIKTWDLDFKDKSVLIESIFAPVAELELVSAVFSVSELKVAVYPVRLFVLTVKLNGISVVLFVEFIT